MNPADDTQIRLDRLSDWHKQEKHIALALGREAVERFGPEAFVGRSIKEKIKGREETCHSSAPEAKAEKLAEEALKAAPAVDVALFGRMVADDPSLNFDAAAQVAHAISTHTVHNEYDYFTAVDDCAPEDNAGAGHLGTVEYQSATLYRYASVHVTELAEHLGERTPDAVRAFVEAFIRSMPTGKINTFANHVVPNAVYVTVRCDQPINLVGAFEKPVVAGGNGYVKPSVEALVEHAQKLYRDFLGEPEYAFVIGDGMEQLGEKMSLPVLLDAIAAAVKDAEGLA